jgi:ketol-acid reductoisomerase
MNVPYNKTMRNEDKAKKQVTIIGYGSQGRALALNLRDSGYEVVLGLRPRSKSRTLARKDRFGHVADIAKAVTLAPIIVFAFPDHLHSRVFRQHIEKNLQAGVTLLFLHGMSVHFGLVKPPKDCDVILIAPHAPGQAVRQKFLSGRDISAFYAIHQNSSRHAQSTVTRLAGAMGFEKKRLIRTSFGDEAIGDMFGEQAVLCGGLAMLIKHGFETLTSHGLKPEHAWLEVAYQLDLIINLVKQYGIEGMLRRISVAARYGSVMTGPKVISASARKQMEKAFREIHSGRFPKKLDSLTESQIRKLDQMIRRLSNPTIEKAARKFSR